MVIFRVWVGSLVQVHRYQTTGFTVCRQLINQLTTGTPLVEMSKDTWEKMQLYVHTLD